MLAGRASSSCQLVEPALSCKRGITDNRHTTDRQKDNRHKPAT